jgi:hypothetical protein
MSAGVPQSLNPFSNLDEWENVVEDRYRERKTESEFRQYENDNDKAMLEWVRSQSLRPAFKRTLQTALETIEILLR